MEKKKGRKGGKEGGRKKEKKKRESKQEGTKLKEWFILMQIQFLNIQSSFQKFIKIQI